MNNSDQKQTKFAQRTCSYLKSHTESVGLLLAAYGTFYLTSVLLSSWTLTDWGKDITGIPPSTFNTLLPRGFIDPIFFVTSFPALVIGSAILCIYSVREISSETSTGKQYIAIILAAFGFVYQVIGAWPLGQLVNFPWQWQKQIITFGPIFSWTLYLLSLTVLAIGGISLYKHSLIYHTKHPELNQIE